MNIKIAALLGKQIGEVITWKKSDKPTPRWLGIRAVGERSILQRHTQSHIFHKDLGLKA